MSTPVFLHFISYVRIKAVRFLVQFFNSTEHWSLRVLVKFIKTSSIVRSTLMIFCYSKASLYESKLLWSYFVEQAYNPFHRKATPSTSIIWLHQTLAHFNQQLPSLDFSWDRSKTKMRPWHPNAQVISKMFGIFLRKLSTFRFFWLPETNSVWMDLRKSLF